VTAKNLVWYSVWAFFVVMMSGKIKEICLSNLEYKSLRFNYRSLFIDAIGQ
jgi:hypothetical protein